jgi:preprotein translocase subunit SecG
MYGFLLTLLVLDGIVLTLIILLQAGKGGGLAAMGGGVTATDGVLGGRQATTFLTRATWVAGSAFMVLALALAIISSRGQQPGSILQQGIQPPTAPSTVIPGAEQPPEPVAPVPDDAPAGDVPPPQP